MWCLPVESLPHKRAAQRLALLFLLLGPPRRGDGPAAPGACPVCVRSLQVMTVSLSHSLRWMDGRLPLSLSSSTTGSLRPRSADPAARMNQQQQHQQQQQQQQQMEQGSSRSRSMQRAEPQARPRSASSVASRSSVSDFWRAEQRRNPEQEWDEEERRMRPSSVRVASSVSLPPSLSLSFVTFYVLFFRPARSGAPLSHPKRWVVCSPIALALKSTGALFS